MNAVFLDLTCTLLVTVCATLQTCEELHCPEGQYCEENNGDARCVLDPSSTTTDTTEANQDTVTMTTETSEESESTSTLFPTRTITFPHFIPLGGLLGSFPSRPGFARIPSCATIRCMEGYHCEEIGLRGRCVKDIPDAHPGCAVILCMVGTRCIEVDGHAQCVPINGYTTPETPTKCGPNEVPDKCGNPCEATCQEPNPLCPEFCREGVIVCHCNNQAGYIRDETTGNCVRKEQCPCVS